MKHHVIRVPGVVSDGDTLDQDGTAFSSPILHLRHSLQFFDDPYSRWSNWIDTLNPRERYQKRKAMERLIEVARK